MQSKHIMATSLTVLFVILNTFCAYSQSKTLKYDTPMDENIPGYYEQLPENYNTNVQKKYPLIIFLSGSGPTGDGTFGSLDKILATTGTVIYRSWHGDLPSSFNVNGKNVEYIIISPQFRTEPYLYKKQGTGNREINALLNYCFSNYRVNLDQVYLTGTSAGAYYSLDYISSNAQNASKITAVVACEPGDGGTAQKGSIIARAQIPVWFTVAEKDLKSSQNGDSTFYYREAQNWLNYINNATPPPTVSAEMFVLWGLWNHNSPNNYTFNPTTLFNGINIYQWMLQFEKGVLPVTGLNLKAKNDYGDITLSWRTASEQNNKGFYIQRSADGKHFEELSFVAGRNAPNGSAYQFVDNRPLPGTAYYRLRQVDFDGKETYSKIVNVQSANIALKIFPNPVRNVLTLAFSTPPQHAVARIYDNLGKLVKELKVHNMNKIDINVANLPTGMYSGLVTGDGEPVKFSFIKK